MPERILKMFSLVVLGILIGGCSSLATRGYVETRDRVDQDIDGNAGYLQGTPSELNEPTKKTRKVYVLEVSKRDPEDGVVKRIEDEPAPPTKNVEPSEQEPEPSSETSAEPPSGLTSEPSSVTAPAEHPPQPSTPSPAISSSPVSVELPTQYTVGQNDTLQTISKKFYNSYSKWQKIYEVNKEKIKDPNRIRRGVVLTIPAL